MSVVWGAPLFVQRQDRTYHLYPRDPSTFSEGDWRHCYVGLEGPVVPSEKVIGSLGIHILKACIPGVIPEASKLQAKEETLVRTQHQFVGINL